MIPLVEKYRPLTIDAFIGMDRARAALSQFAANPYSSAWLLVGPSGLGKTSMALALQKQIGGDLHHIPSSKCDKASVDEVCSKCYYLPWKGSWHTILVDEGDQMSHAAQLAFLSKLDATAQPPNSIFLFTANDTALLKDRFLSRCRVVKFTNDAGLLAGGEKLLRTIWGNEAPATQPWPDFRAMLQESGFNIRAAIMNLELEIMAPGSFAPAVKLQQPKQPKPSAPAPQADSHLPPPGTELVREFKNLTVKVRILEDGFQYKERRYKSLSAIAREATGSNWNGYSFFRLKGAAA